MRGHFHFPDFVKYATSCNAVTVKIASRINVIGFGAANSAMTFTFSSVMAVVQFSLLSSTIPEVDKVSLQRFLT